MAQNNITKRKVYYRKVEFVPTKPQTMQQMLAHALQKNALVSERSEMIGSQANELRVIGRFKTVAGFLCGQLVTYERGSFQTVINDEPSAKALSLDAIAPPKIKNVQQQFVPGVLYFAVWQNHIVIVQSAAVRTSALELHLAWLLRSKSEILTNQDGFVLRDEPQPATKAKIRKAHVKSVSLGRPLMYELAPETDQTNQVGAKQVTRWKPDNAFVNLFKDLFQDSTQFEKLGLENGLYDGNLEVWIEIRYPKRQRSKSEDSIQLLDNLGIALRDLDEDEARLTLADGTVVEGKDLKISSYLEVKLNSKKIPDEDDIFSEMTSWLNEQIKNGVVAPD